MEINERWIKLSSRLPFSKDIPLGEDIEVLIQGRSYIANSVKIEEDKQDGTMDRVYKPKFTAE